MNVLAKIYIKEIVRLHGVPPSIVSDLDGCFTSAFWNAFQNTIGTKMHMSTTYNPQTDGNLQRTIQTPKDLLQMFVLDRGGKLDL